MSASRKDLIVDDDEGVRLFVQAIMEGERWLSVEGITGRTHWI